MIEQIAVILETGGLINSQCSSYADTIERIDCGNVETFYRSSYTYRKKPVFRFLSRCPLCLESWQVSTMHQDSVNIEPLPITGNSCRLNSGHGVRLTLVNAG